MNAHEDRRDRSMEEWEAEIEERDDAVIGRAFRISILVLVAVGALVGGGLLLLNRPEPATAPVAIPTSAPQAVASDQTAPDLPFTDITAEAGVDFVHFNGAYGDKLLPETMGGGVAFFDADADGHQDLLLVNGAPWPGQPMPNPPPLSRLYLGDGQGGFTDVTDTAALGGPLQGMGVAVGDYDGDGLVDVYITAVGENRLLRNEGGTFSDVTTEAGVAGTDEDWSTSAAFFDYDGDGDLDLYVVNYVVWSPEIDFAIDYRLTGVGRAYGQPQNYEGTLDFLYRNDGDGTFTEVGADAGIHVLNPATGGPVGKGLGVAPVDIDGDGWMDVFVANDTVRNFLFHNQGDGTFDEVAELWGVAYDRSGNATGAMGVDVGYHRDDETLALVIGNFANEMTSVYVSQGDPTIYADEAIGEGIGAPSRRALTFGVFLFDADLDGRQDLLQANGHLEEEIAQVDPSQSYRQPAQLFWNAGPEAERGFMPVDDVGDLATPIAGRGATYADIDGDGDLDVLLTQVAGRPLLLRNDQPLDHHWLRVRLQQPPEGGPVIGTKVELQADGRTQRRQVVPARSYLSQVPTDVTFGLGPSAPASATLRITWPDGTQQTRGLSEVDREIVLP